MMWSMRCGSLRRAALEDLAALEAAAYSDAVALSHASQGGEEVEQCDDATAERSNRIARRGSGPGTKRLAFEAALSDQVRSGDLRLFSGDERERNSAAYQATASLPVPLPQGAARRYVVQALLRLGDVGSADYAPVSAIGSEADGSGAR